MKLLFILLSIMLMSSSSYADLVRPIFFSDMKYPQRCENLCEVLKQRLIGVLDTEKQEQFLHDYNECKASYDKALNFNILESWCGHIYVSPCRGACQIRCGSHHRRRRDSSNIFYSAEERKKCQEEGEKRCAECKEQQKESWHTYLREYLLKEEEPKEITTLPDQSPNNADAE